MSFDPISYSKAKSVQVQLDQVIQEGDQLAETQQARVDNTGIAHTTLKARLDSDFSKTNQRIDAQIIDFNTHLADYDAHVAESASEDVHGLLSQGKIIEESGSNENGVYIKFANGTMICSGRFSTVTSINNTEGMAPGWNRNATTHYTNNQFLRPFIEVPHMSYSISAVGYDARDIMVGTDFSTTTEARPQLISPRAHTGASLEISYTAIGRWK